jgi:hypothetical protein
MPNSLHFSERAAHYRRLAEMTADDRTAADLRAVSNLFMQMSYDLRTLERDCWRKEILARHCKTHAVDKFHGWLSRLIESFQDAHAIDERLRRIRRSPQALVLTPHD